MKIGRIDEYKIHSYDSDMNGRLSLPILTRFLQETAWLNAEDMGLGYEKFLDEDMAWVLYKQYMQIDKWPIWGDMIKIKTWPSQSDKLFCYREFEIFKAEELIGKVASSWLVINLSTRRPVRTSKYYLKDHQINDQMLFPEKIIEKMESMDTFSNEFEQQVQLTDIDVNFHVNNSLYPQWCLNNYSLDFYKTHIITEVEQQFIAEAQMGDRLNIITNQSDINKYDHCIRREGKDIFRIRLKWKKI